ncbi:hypothetical protein WUBG_17311, partial [Wuchereria bancrofti]
MKKNRFCIEKHAGDIAVDVEENGDGKVDDDPVIQDMNLELNIENRDVQTFPTETELGRKIVKKLRIRDEDIKHDNERIKRLQNLDRRK